MTTTATVHVAAIEWPALFINEATILVNRDYDALAKQIRAVIHEVADGLTDPEWRDALAQNPDMLPEEALEMHTNRAPIVTYVQREV